MIFLYLFSKGKRTVITLGLFFLCYVTHAQVIDLIHGRKDKEKLVPLVDTVSLHERIAANVKRAKELKSKSQDTIAISKAVGLLKGMEKHFTPNLSQTDFKELKLICDSILNKPIGQPTREFVMNVNNLCIKYFKNPSNSKTNNPTNGLFVDFTIDTSEVKIKCYQCDSNTNIYYGTDGNFTKIKDSRNLLGKDSTIKISNDSILLVALYHDNRPLALTKFILPGTIPPNGNTLASIISGIGILLLLALMFYIYLYHFSKSSKTLKSNDEKYLKIKKYIKTKHNVSNMSTQENLERFVNGLEEKINTLQEAMRKILIENKELVIRTTELSKDVEKLKGELKKLSPKHKEESLTQELTAPESIPAEPPAPALLQSCYNLPYNDLLIKQVEPDDKDAFVIIEYEENKNEATFHLNEKKQGLLLKTIDSLKLFCEIENLYEIQNPTNVTLVRSGIVIKNANGQWQIKQKADIRLA